MPSLVPAAEQKGLCLIQCIILCQWHARSQKKNTKSQRMGQTQCYSTYSKLKEALNYWAKVRYSEFKTKCKENGVHYTEKNELLSSG